MAACRARRGKHQPCCLVPQLFWQEIEDPPLLGFTPSQQRTWHITEAIAENPGDVARFKECFPVNRLGRAVTGVSRLYIGRQAGPMGSKDLYVSTNSWCPRLSEQVCVPEATSSTFL